MTNEGGLVPTENIRIYELLYLMEVGLRELIIESLQEKYGPRWFKDHLPGDVLERYRTGRQYERSCKWIQLVPHHPLYYTDFPDLRKVIERAENWEAAFQDIFKRKDILASTLSELEPIRNKIAHNRKATKTDLQVAEAVHAKLASSIGARNFSRLAMKCTEAPDLLSLISQLRQEAGSAFAQCAEYKALGPLQVWDRVQATWWFDSDYLGHEINAIAEYFEALSTYSGLPRHRGTGHSIEAWVYATKLKEKYQSAEGQLELLLGEPRGA